MNSKPNFEYKESEITWLPLIPAHWNTLKGKHLFTKMNRPISTFDEVVTCFRDGTVTLRKNRRLRGFTESIKEIGYQGIRKGDLVIHVMDAFAGAIGVSDSDGKATPVYSVCKPKLDLNPHFYALIIREMARIGYITCLAKGIRERSTDFRFETFAAQLLPLPPIDEQNVIAYFIDWKTRQINKFIQKKKQLIVVLKEQKQAIINQAVTRGLDPKVMLKSSGVEWLGDIPEHWEVKSIKRAAKILRGKFSHRPRNDPALYDGPFPFIQTGDVARSKKYIKKYSQTLNEKGFCVSKQFPKHTLVMTIAANIGDVAILNFDACFPDSIVGLVPFKEINLDFLYLVLTSMKPELLKQAPVNTQGNLNVERIGSLKIAIPTIHEQLELVKQIEEKTQVIDSLVEKNLSTIELAQEYRTRLISEVVTGQIDVRDIEISDIVERELIEETFEEEQEEESLEFVGAGDDD